MLFMLLSFSEFYLEYFQDVLVKLRRFFIFFFYKSSNGFLKILYNYGKKYAF